MDSIRVGTVLLLTMFVAHVGADGACSKESPNDVAALLQGALGVQRLTDTAETLQEKSSRGATHENERVHKQEESLRQEEEEDEEAEQHNMEDEGEDEDLQSEMQSGQQQESEEQIDQQEIDKGSGDDEFQTLSAEARSDEQRETDGDQQEILEDEHKLPSLLQVDEQDVEDVDGQSASEQGSVPPGWFGEFSHGESSFTPSGRDSSKDNPEWIAKYGSNPSLKSPLENAGNVKSEWFQESRSGGPGAAWQTNYPALTATIGGSRGKENPWRRTPTGWVQDYLSEGHGPRSASWFDDSVRQIDGFGREMQPEVSDPKRYVGVGWKKRAVRAPLSCKTPGCAAQASLQLFDTTKEEAHLCTLSVAVHPTDYDDDYSREHIEFLKINAHIANFNVDKLADKNGKILIQAKNSALVDECPYKGNLLSGVATASCMVRNRDLNPNLASKKPKATTLVSKGVLKCVKPGCTAETTVHVGQKGGKCTMNMTVYQTDFDGAPEQLDFIQVGGQNVTKAPVKPGKNPCNMAFKGKKPGKADRIFVALKNHDVTKLVAKSGAVQVKARISASVDECAYKGNLLYGDVVVSCLPSSSKPSSKTAPAKAPAKKAPAKKASAKAPAKAKALAKKSGKKA